MYLGMEPRSWVAVMLCVPWYLVLEVCQLLLGVVAALFMVHVCSTQRHPHAGSPGHT